MRAVTRSKWHGQKELSTENSNSFKLKPRAKDKGSGMLMYSEIHTPVSGSYFREREAGGRAKAPQQKTNQKKDQTRSKRCFFFEDYPTQ